MGTWTIQLTQSVVDLHELSWRFELSVQIQRIKSLVQLLMDLKRFHRVPDVCVQVVELERQISQHEQQLAVLELFIVIQRIVLDPVIKQKLQEQADLTLD